MGGKDLKNEEAFKLFPILHIKVAKSKDKNEKGRR